MQVIAKAPTAKRILRSLLAVVIGILVISMVVEALEFGLVTLINGEPTTDPDVYYAVRNTLGFLALKLLYNTGAAVAAGYLAFTADVISADWWRLRAGAMLKSVGLMGTLGGSVREC